MVRDHLAPGAGEVPGRVVVKGLLVLDTCMPTIRITATTGIGITKQIAAEVII